jgi:glycosyltransferase involved in cell wall biosynthesis
VTAPHISVCIPTRDRARWLGEALDSVFAQTRQDFEVIVGDDASTDATPELLARYGDPRLRVLHHPRALGVAGNRNSCLLAARGELVAWLDSDDRWLPHMLETQAGLLDRHPAVVFAHGGAEIVGEDGERLPDWPPALPGDVVERGIDAFAELTLRNYVTAPTVVARRLPQVEAGGYRVDLPSGEDWEMWLRLALRGDVAYTAAPVAQYRWHSGSLARSAAASGDQLARDLRAVTGVFARHRREIPRAAQLERRARAALAGRALLHGTDRLTRGDRRGTLAAVALAARARPALLRSRAGWRLAAAGGLRAEYPWHVTSRALLDRLARELEGSRMAQRLRAAAAAPAEWEETLRTIAARVREVVPPTASIVVVDKWDPTVLHLSRRRGWHFPDRRTMADGYPRDSAAAVAHLEELRRRGARHVVFPCSAFWWLDAYTGLARHLTETAERVWDDAACVIWRFRGGDPERAARPAGGLAR